MVAMRLFWLLCSYIYVALFVFICLWKAGDVGASGSRLTASSRYRGSRESLQSGMTYSARRNSNSSMYNGTRTEIYFYYNFYFLLFFSYFMFLLFWLFLFLYQITTITMEVLCVILIMDMAGHVNLLVLAISVSLPMNHDVYILPLHPECLG